MVTAAAASMELDGETVELTWFIVTLSIELFELVPLH